MTNYPIAVFFTFAAVWVAAFVYAALGEKKLWNGGTCPLCQNAWIKFDVDSQGGRGYKCSCAPARYIWISYSVDR